MLGGAHFQNAYVCDDIEAAIAAFRAKIGTGEPRILDVDQEVWTPEGIRSLRNRVAFIWRGDLQYELIEPVADIGFYANAPDNGGLLRFHHTNTRVPDWDTFRADVDRQEMPVVMEKIGGEGGARFLYLDGRALFGHYLEFVWMSDESWTLFKAM
jgi:hypothetical protein